MTPPAETTPPQPPQGAVLAVHTSQLTRENLATLAAQGYGILPDQSGWLIFVRVPQESDRSHVVRRPEPYLADQVPAQEASSGAQRAEPLDGDGEHS